MNIGVPKEIKIDESRVALRPDQAAVLKTMGHEIFVESSAGLKSGFTDEDYVSSGANIVTASKIYSRCKLILKVKCPLESEYQFYSPDHVLFTYLHFDENIKAENILRIASGGLTAIAYEWVRVGSHLPLLDPMSELTGAVFARKAMSLLMDNKGLLGGSYMSSWPRAAAMVIGAGHIGSNAVKVFIQNNYKVIIVDKNPNTLAARLSKYIAPAVITSADIDTITFDELAPARSCDRIRQQLPKTDIVICAAVRRPSLPKELCEFLITADDLSLMSAGSVICDATACDRDLIESCVSSDSLTYTYTQNGVIHYNCDHIPALVPQTSTRILTDATFPYVQLLAQGPEAALAKSPPLASAVMCCLGSVTHEYCARKKGLDFTPLENLLPISGPTLELQGASNV